MAGFCIERIGISYNKEYIELIEQLLNCCGGDFHRVNYFDPEVGTVSEEFRPYDLGNYKNVGISLNRIFNLMNELFGSTYLYYELEAGNSVVGYHCRHEEIYNPTNKMITGCRVEYCYGTGSVLEQPIFNLPIVIEECEKEAKKAGIKYAWSENEWREKYPLGDDFSDLCCKTIENLGGYETLGTKTFEKKIRTEKITKKQMDRIIETAEKKGYFKLVDRIINNKL